MSTQFATVTALPTGPRPTEKCRQAGTDPDAWSPNEPPVERPNDRVAYEAKARDLCAGCPFTVTCLERELREAGRSTHGIFGGTAPWERQTIYRNARRGGYDLHEAAIRFHESVEEAAS